MTTHGSGVTAPRKCVWLLRAERRDKLLELARVWTIAALTEGNIVVPPASTDWRMPEGLPR